MSQAYIIDAVRTPRGIGKVGKGSLAHLHPQQLATSVLKAIVDRNGIDTASIDDVVWSTSSQRGKLLRVQMGQRSLAHFADPARGPY
ncbi:MAG: hypothetical protein EON93_24300, partial [Burkholderiales bacterium]